ncbi:MAG: serine hydrolase domain-containing protein [Bacillota bacterium]
MSNTLKRKIDAVFSKWKQGVCPGGQVAVRQRGEIIYSSNFGYADIEHKIPVTDDTVFHVASVSKQITVMCILLLHEEGRLSIKDDIRKYIPELIQFSEPVTICSMMSNVSGIRDQWELLMLSGVRIADTITQKDALNIISKQKSLNFEPLSQYLYSNSNFTMLAEVIERVSGRMLNEFAAEKIFNPLGMKHTTYKDSYWKVIHDRANSYYDNGTGEFINCVLNYGTYGATSLNTTAIDFLKWMDNYKNPIICNKATLERMFSVPTLKEGAKSNYAGGLFTGEHRGHKYIEHGGADAAFRSQIMRFTEDDIDIVIFSNTQNILLKQAAFSIADIILGCDKDSDAVSEYYAESFDISYASGYYAAYIPDLVMQLLEIFLVDEKPCIATQYGVAPLVHISGNLYKISHLHSEVYFGEKPVIKVGENFIPLRRLYPYKPTPEKMSMYVGRYESDELDTFYNIIDEKGVMNIVHSRNGSHTLFEIEKNMFLAVNEITFLVEFIEESGKVSGLLLTSGRVKSILFSKTVKEK